MINPTLLKHTFTAPYGTPTGICGAPIDAPSGFILMLAQREHNAAAGTLRECLRSLHRELKISHIDITRICQMGATYLHERHWYNFTQLLSKQGHRWVRHLQCLKLWSLEFKVVAPEGSRNPSWQNIKVFYHGTWDRYLTGKPRLSVSLEKFLKDHTSLTGTLSKEFGNLMLTEVLKMEDISNIFEIVHGETTGAAKVMTQWYTEYASGGSNPNPEGSCMRHEADNDAPYRDLDGHHPVEVFAVPDVSMARLKHPITGRTTMRALLNNVEKSICRVYNGYSGDQRSSMETAFVETLQNDYGYTEGVNFSWGLTGCLLKCIPLDNGGWLMPYLDGERYIEDKGDSGWLVGGANDYIAENTDGTVGYTGKCTCDSCGCHYTEDEARSINDSGDTVCQGCYDSYYFTCEHCEEIYPSSTAIGIGHEYYCENCADSNFYRCTECDAWSSDSTDDNDRCQSCAEDLGYYYYCDNCEDYTCEESPGDALCPDCWAEANPEEELEATNDEL